MAKMVLLFWTRWKILFTFHINSTLQFKFQYFLLHKKSQKRCQTSIPLYRHESANYAPNSGDLELKTVATRRCVENKR